MTRFIALAGFLIARPLPPIIDTVPGMTAKQIVAIPSVEEAARLASEQVVDLCRDLEAAKEQLAWFERQMSPSGFAGSDA